VRKWITGFFFFILLFSSVLADTSNVWLENFSVSACSVVTVDVCVTDSLGHYVRGLGLSNFNFVENDSLIPTPPLAILSDCPPCTTCVDIVIFIDMSTSMDDDVARLRAEIPRFVAGISGTDYRISIIRFNGCSAYNRRIIRTDFSSSFCHYEEAGPDLWATSEDEFSCLFDASYDVYWGSGYEDQYGAMVMATDSLDFRDGCRVCYLLFTDERPQTDTGCEPYLDESEESLEWIIAYLNEHGIDCFPITPHDGEFEYWWSGGESPERRYYTGYYRLGPETGGGWFYLYSEDFGALVDSITASISSEPCCYAFSYITREICEDTTALLVNVVFPGGVGSVDTMYLSPCPPTPTEYIPYPCGGITTCSEQEISVLLPEVAHIDSDAVVLRVDSSDYTIRDTELTILDRNRLLFVPSTPFENGDTVAFSVPSAVDIFSCEDEMDVCRFIVDTEPPYVVSTYPEEAETLRVPPDSIVFVIADDIAGIDASSVSVDDFTLIIRGDTIRDFSLSYSDGMALLSDFPGLSGDYTVCIRGVLDAPTYTYCPPNEMDEFCLSFTARLVTMDEYLPVIFARAMDTIFVPLISSSSEGEEIASLHLLWGVSPDVAFPIGATVLLPDWTIDSLFIDEDAGTLYLEAAGSPVMVDDGDTLLFVMARVRQDVSGGDFSPLYLMDVTFNDNYPFTRLYNGLVYIDWNLVPWMVDLVFNRVPPTPQELTLTFGVSSAGTDGFDCGLDVIRLPPIPDRVNAYFLIDDSLFWALSRDIRCDTCGFPVVWTLVTEGEEDARFEWNPELFPEGEFFINNWFDMRRDGTSFEFGLDETLTISWTQPAIEEGRVELFRGWNLVSFPLFPTVDDWHQLFPESPAAGFLYDPEYGRYISDADILRGKGYWVLSLVDTFYIIPGERQDGYRVQLFDGWNMISALSDTVEFAPTTSPPGALVFDEAYSFDPVGRRYVSSDTLIPGKGYWVLAASNCILSIGTGELHKRGSSPVWVGEVSCGKDVVEFGYSPDSKDGPDRNDVPIPPMPPETVEGNRLHFIRGEISLARDISPDAEFLLYYPGGDGKLVPPPETVVKLLEGDKQIFSASEVKEFELPEGRYRLLVEILPDEPLILFPAYPNPFNSSVTISWFQNGNGKVNLSLYNILGEKVLNWEIEGERGNNQYLFSPDGLSSGIFFYRVKFDGHSRTGKMLFVK